MASHHPRNTNGPADAAAGPAPSSSSYYEQQREMLMSEIAQSLEHVLQNANRLNRSLEEVIQVGNEFAPVESLWSHFESVMGARAAAEEGGKEEKGGKEGESGGEDEGETEGETEVGASSEK